MTASLILKHGEHLSRRITKISAFTFVKEAYTPYTRLNAVFDGDEADIDNCSEVLFYLDDRLIHHGLADNIKVTSENGVKRGVLSSRGFTSLLLENQLAPGFYMNLSINSLVDNYFQIPFISHEDSSVDSGYIFVKSGSVMWDGVVNLAYKLSRTYPYISGTNTIMVNPKAVPLCFAYDNSYIVNSGSELLTTKISSHYHMADIQGNYGSHEYTVPEAQAMNIVRHKHFDLDRRFLYDPDLAPEYRGKLSTRGWKRRFCTYYGYNGEDIYDMLSIDQSPSKRIGKIRITGDQTGIRTELSIYTDSFVGNI